MKLAPAASVLLALGAGSSIREELPLSHAMTTSVEASTPAIPLVVVAAPLPTAAPRNGTDTSAHRVTQVTADVHSALRRGRLVASANPIAGDVIYLNCTPRDANGNPTHAHGPLQAWLVSGDAAYDVQDAATLNADLFARGPGTVDVACRVDGITSAPTRLHIGG